LDENGESKSMTIQNYHAMSQLYVWGKGGGTLSGAKDWP